MSEQKTAQLVFRIVSADGTVEEERVALSVPGSTAEEAKHNLGQVFSAGSTVYSAATEAHAQRRSITEAVIEALKQYRDTCR